MIEEIQRLLLNRGLTFQESPFREQCQSDYWQSTVVDSARRPLASGFANERLQARKIAVSELLERETFREIKASDAVTRSAWGLDTHPTACGFAAGFNRENVIERSLGEAVERWVMSLWIDDGYFIPQIPSAIVVESLDPVSKYFCSHFDEVLFYQNNVIVDTGDGLREVCVAQTMGLKDGGIFPGSSAQKSGATYWQHALLESFRHIMGNRNNPASDQFPANKVKYFASHADEALAQIGKARQTRWPVAKVDLHKVLGKFSDQFFVCRTRVEGWRSWDEGPLARFVY